MNIKLPLLEALAGRIDEASDNAIATADAKFKKMPRAKLLKYLGMVTSNAQQTYLVLQALYKKFDKADVDRYIKNH